MSSPRRSLMVPFFICVLLLVVTPLSGQSREEDYPDSFADEVTGTVFEKTAKPIGELVRMIEVDGRIQLLNNWDKSDARAARDSEPNKELEARIQKYVDDGMDRAMAERISSSRLGSSRKGMLRGFMKVQAAIGRGGGSGGSPGEKEWDFRLRSGSLGGHTRSDERATRLQFFDYENDLDFYISKKKEDAGFEFRFCSAHGLVELRQSKDEVRLAIIQGGVPSVVSADTFRELIQENPQALRDELLPLWEALGIQVPLNLANDKVIEAALAKLSAFENDEMQVQALLEDLTGDSMNDRNNAYEELLEGYFRWRELIDKLKGDPMLASSKD